MVNYFSHDRFAYTSRFEVLHDFRDELVKQLNLYLLSEKSEGRRTDLVELEFMSVVREAMGTFLLGKTIRSPTLSNLGLGLPRENPWKPYLRFVKRKVLSNSLSYKPRRFISKSDIITFSTTPLILKHAEQSGKSLVSSTFQDWFGGGRIVPPHLNDLATNALNDVVGIITDSAKKFDSELSVEVLGDLRRDLEEYFKFAAFYKARLEAASKLPDEVWIGSSGMLFNRVFAWVVMQRGGRVIGHDHGTGESWSTNYSEIINEIPYVTKFVTYSTVMAHELRRHFDEKGLFFRNSACEIIGLVQAKQTEALGVGHEKLPTIKSGPNSVMYVTTVFSGEEVIFNPLLPDDTMLCLHAKIFSWCREEKCKVFLKPHPESLIEHPPALLAKEKVTVINGRFKDVSSLADVLIFDYPSTTAFALALQSEKPIVLIDLGISKLTDLARSLLERRVSIVNATLDSNGMVHLEKNCFIRALLSSYERVENKDFFNTYFGMAVE